MAILKMKKLNIVASIDDRTAILKSLQEKAITSIDENVELLDTLQEKMLLSSADVGKLELAKPEQFAKILSDFRNAEGAGRILSDLQVEDLVQESERWQDRVLRSISILASYQTEKKPLFSQRKIVSLEKRFMSEDEQLQTMNVVLTIENLVQKKNDLTQKQASTQNHLNAIEDWKEFSLPEKLDSSSIKSSFGYFSSEEEWKEFEQAIEDADLPLAVEIFNKNETVLGAVLAWPEEMDSEVRRLIAQSRLKNFPAMNELEKEGKYAESYRQLETSKQEIQDDLEKIEVDFANLVSAEPDLQLFHDVLEADIQSLKASSNIVDSEYLTVFSGYVPTKVADVLKQDLENTYQAVVTLEDPAEDDELVPTQLENSTFATPIESIINTFSSPHYFEDVDPSWIMMLTYAFFFGSMLSDVGYGLVLAIGCLVALFKFKAEGGMRQMLYVFLAGGIASIGFGILYGSFFGGVLSTLTNGAFDLPVLWFDPMDKPIDLMIWSMVFGVVHLFIAMGIDIYNKYRKGEWYDATFLVAPWYFVILGAGLMLIGVEFGKWLAIFGAGVLVLMSSKSKNPFLRIFSGLGEVFGITSWLSDILSYTRILALTLATSVIAMVVNLMAGMIGMQGIKIVFVIIVLIFGHVLNLALSTLSAYVHSTRLHYVEFFGKFYTGGGRLFSPLRYDGKFTRFEK